MNAVIREEFEVPVISRDELLEIRQDIRELRADNKKLGEKIDAVHNTLRDKMDEGFCRGDEKRESLRREMQEGFRIFDAKLEKLCGEMHEGFRIVDAKQEQLRGEMQEGFAKFASLKSDIADMRALQKAMIWMIGVIGSVATLLLAAGKALSWF